MKILKSDFVVVGTGIAGLMTAIDLSKKGTVLVITKKQSTDSNTNYAQGGIACVVASDDSFESHVQDTLDAGAGLCDEDIVRGVVEAGPERITALERFGVHFSEQRQGSGYDLGKEGGHTHRRVLHSGDITGRQIEDVLLDQVHSSEKITVIEQCMVIDLITTGWLGEEGGEEGENRCVGAYVLNRDSGEIFAVRSPCVILATGGGSKVYLYTSNPDIATGDGVAIAWRAGVPIKNMEFIQFHPTCLYHPDAGTFLISEAVRGEGAKLVDANGNEFMHKYDDRGALAPRDIVARAIDHEMKTRGTECMYLDIRHKGSRFLRRRFPNIYLKCMDFGIDMARDLVPVVPAAHYFCGGIEADLDGCTALPGLFACGEVACTGLHGANRLASNSLLEAVVCSGRLAEKLVSGLDRSVCDGIDIPDWQLGDAVPSDETIVVEHNWNEVRTCMWDYVGIVRTDKRLVRALSRVRNLRREIREYYLDYLVTADVLELRNIADVAELIIRSAQMRKESRGLHFTLDYPDKSDALMCDTVIADPAGGEV